MQYVRKRRKIFGNEGRRIFGRKLSERKKKHNNVSIEEFERMLHENSLSIYGKWK